MLPSADPFRALFWRASHHNLLTVASPMERPCDGRANYAAPRLREKVWGGAT